MHLLSPPLQECHPDLRAGDEFLQLVQSGSPLDDPPLDVFHPPTPDPPTAFVTSRGPPRPRGIGPPRARWSPGRWPRSRTVERGPPSPSPGKDFRDTDTAAPHQGQGTPSCSPPFMPDSTAIPTRAVPKTHLPQGVHPTSHAGRERPTDAARGRRKPDTLSTSTRSGPLTGLTHVPRADKIP